MQFFKIASFPERSESFFKQSSSTTQRHASNSALMRWNSVIVAESKRNIYSLI